MRNPAGGGVTLNWDLYGSGRRRSNKSTGSCKCISASMTLKPAFIPPPTLNLTSMYCISSALGGNPMIRLPKMLFAFAVAAMIAAPAWSQERDMKFTLDFIPLGRHAPWYVAVAKGYYKEEGLNVTIVPARGTADSIRALDSGVVD